jgi:hypothetical protein
MMLDSTQSGVIIDAVRKGFTFRGMKVRAAALYADGNWPAPPAAFSLLHRHGIQTADITVTGNPAIKAARVAADDEPGDLTPEQAAQWAEGEMRAGEWPVIYVNRANKPDTIKLCVALGMEPARDFGLWIATLDSTFADTGGADLRTEPGVVAVQAFPAAQLGIEADGSVLTTLGHKWLGLQPTWQARAVNLAHELAALVQEHA